MLSQRKSMDVIGCPPANLPMGEQRAVQAWHHLCRTARLVSGPLAPLIQRLDSLVGVARRREEVGDKFAQVGSSIMLEEKYLPNMLTDRPNISAIGTDSINSARIWRSPDNGNGLASVMNWFSGLARQCGVYQEQTYMSSGEVGRNAKQSRLRSLSNQRGVVAALALDQRKSLRRLMADSAGMTVDKVDDAQLIEFKTAVTEVLTPHASAILLDPEYGQVPAKHRAPGCGLMLAYELDGYENPRPNKMLALMPRLSVRHLRDMGADGIKILLHYAPGDLPEVNEEKCALIERIGNECAALNMPFFFEPIVYEPASGISGLNAGISENAALEFARRKPELVIATMREFSRAQYRVDVLKVECGALCAWKQDTPRTVGLQHG